MKYVIHNPYFRTISAHRCLSVSNASLNKLKVHLVLVFPLHSHLTNLKYCVIPSKTAARNTSISQTVFLFPLVYPHYFFLSQTIFQPFKQKWKLSPFCCILMATSKEGYIYISSFTPALLYLCIYLVFGKFIRKPNFYSSHIFCERIPFSGKTKSR